MRRVWNHLSLEVLQFFFIQSTSNNQLMINEQENPSSRSLYPHHWHWEMIFFHRLILYVIKIKELKLFVYLFSFFIQFSRHCEHIICVFDIKHVLKVIFLVYYNNTLDSNIIIYYLSQVMAQYIMRDDIEWDFYSRFWNGTKNMIN